APCSAPQAPSNPPCPMPGHGWPSFWRMAMTDLDKRLEADGRSWRRAIGIQAPAALPPTAPTGRTWNRWLMPAAVAAALVGVTVGVFGLAHVPRARQSGPAAAAAQVDLGCSF